MDDPLTADLNRKPKQGVAKIGTEPRVRFSLFLTFLDASEHS
jgi:hypothetical protein